MKGKMIMQRDNKEEKEINELRDENIEKFFTKLGCTTSTILIVLILLSFSLNIVLTPTMAILSFLLPTVFLGIELCIKDKILKSNLRKNDLLIKTNCPNINTDLTNEQIINIVNNVPKNYLKNTLEDDKKNDVIDFNDYLKIQNEESESVKVRKLTR